MRKVKKNKEVSLKNIIDNEIKTNSLRENFPEHLKIHVSKLKDKKAETHHDFTDIPFITIDGEDSKDFDDAVWSESFGKKSKIMVAIADVGFYVENGDPLDKEAKRRANSFYFPDRVIPMFPEELSNNLCSLVPNKKRKSIIVEINFQNGKYKNFKIHRGIIKSFARLTYKQVEGFFFTNKKQCKLTKLINNLFVTYKMLKIESIKREKIFFNPNEWEYDYYDTKEISLKKKKKLQSYNLIEEFMVLTNSIIGNYFKKNKVKSIFRNHEPPQKEKLNIINNIINEYNLDHNGKFNSQKDFNQIIRLINLNKNNHLHDFLLRSQSKAFYGFNNKGHYGLSLDNYVHFTSPIRRYSDLIVHRDLINLYFNNKKEPAIDISDHLNSQEKKADLIERSIMDKFVALYMKKFKYRVFRGFVDAIESFGIFIKALDFPFSGLARIKLKKEKNYNKNKININIGTLVTFKIKRINTFNGKILLQKVKLIENHGN